MTRLDKEFADSRSFKETDQRIRYLKEYSKKADKEFYMTLKNSKNVLKNKKNFLMSKEFRESDKEQKELLKEQKELLNNIIPWGLQ